MMGSTTCKVTTEFPVLKREVGGGATYSIKSNMWSRDKGDAKLGEDNRMDIILSRYLFRCIAYGTKSQWWSFFLKYSKL